MIRCLWIAFWFSLICTSLWAAKTWEQYDNRTEHDALTKGCVMTGTIQGYRMGREGMPAQEQWNCNGMMRTVNAI